MTPIRVEVVWPQHRVLHRRHGTLNGAEHIVHEGLDLGLLYDVTIDRLGDFWLPREHLRLVRRPAEA